MKPQGWAPDATVIPDVTQSVAMSFSLLNRPVAPLLGGPRQGAGERPYSRMH